MGALILELLFELVLEFVIGPVLELVLEPLSKAADRSKLPLFTLAMLAVGGVGIGALLSALHSERILPPLLPGASLVASPICLGLVMHYFGRWRQSRGHRPTPLATFAGGASLGLGMAAGRLLAIVA